MASGTKHFLFNRPGDWLFQGLADGLDATDAGLTLRADKGVYVSLALDTRENETVWHRMRMTAQSPPNASLRLIVYCSDSLYAPLDSGLPPDTELDSWLKHPGTTFAQRENFFLLCGEPVRTEQRDATMYGFRGRYLWFCLIVQNYGGEAVCVRELKLEFPRVAFIDYLPQVYRGPDSVNSFLARFLSVFQSLYVDLEEDMEQLPACFDPASAPPEFLHWLADGLALSDSELWSDSQLRLLLGQAVRLYRKKGTKEALCRVVELYTGHRPYIIEQFEAAGCEMWQRDRETCKRLYGASARSFTLLIPPGQIGTEDCAKLLRIIEQFKPIDAVCSLVVLEDAVQLGRHCYIGFNSRIGGSEPLRLEGYTGCSGAMYLS